MEREIRVYYKIRFPGRAGTIWEWHRSNNGTDAWGSLAKVRAVLTRGIQSGYKGRTHTPFTEYEVVQFYETVETVRDVVLVD